MIWWRWNIDDRCWRPTLVPPAAPFRVNNCARLIPLPRARRWALLALQGATVNGLPCLPLEILAEGDEVCVAGERYWFSAQSPPEAETFASDKKRIRCARCLGRLVDGDQIVLCPLCHAHHHASCWPYDTRCQKCAYPTDGALQVPESLN